MEKPEIKISVRNLVEFILRSGDISKGFVSNSRAVEGTRVHKMLQKSAGENYTPEVVLKWTGEFQSYSIVVEGRADGIIKTESQVIIDEIKTVTVPMDLIDENYNPVHWAQAECYAFIYAQQNSMEEVMVRLTYFNIDTEEIKFLEKTYSFSELKRIFSDLLDKYSVWADFSYEWILNRNKSIKDMEFPFGRYRKGQRELAVAAYRTITSRKKLFVQAPTGIGKTISTLFPAVKAVEEGHGEKIFYLTARTITRQVAEEAFIKMRGRKLRFKTITLIAKEKICMNSEHTCDAETCEFARGHFDRINEAIMDILMHQDNMTREVLTEYSRKHRVCPFEFSLDLTTWMDCIICDYNYVFDPRVYLKRFFLDNGGDYVFLVDEAHNLVDRSREMFSAEISKRAFMDVRKTVKRSAPDIFNTLGKINKCFIELRKECADKDIYVTPEEFKELSTLLRKFTKECEEYIARRKGIDIDEALLELFFQSLSYIRTSESFDERYVTYVRCLDKDVKVKLFCLDPSFLLKEALKRGRSTVFFSATLTPLNYFQEILGGDEEDYTMKLSSPFDRENLCLMVLGNVSTKYKDRQNSYGNIAEYIKVLAGQKTGNYLVFFPSFEYMREVFKLFTVMYPEIEVVVQENSMTEAEREAFLNRFEPVCRNTLIGFAVMGGMFSEGVDLMGERLSGSVIVGVGLPQLSAERDIIMGYYKNKNGLGYEYAYMYPGMNKVLQAAGRVIRTENDKGVVLLVDDRFLHKRYLQLFPREWNTFKKVFKAEEVKEELKNFWSL